MLDSLLDHTGILRAVVFFGLTEHFIQRFSWLRIFLFASFHFLHAPVPSLVDEGDGTVGGGSQDAKTLLSGQVLLLQFTVFPPNPLEVSSLETQNVRRGMQCKLFCGIARA